MSKYQRYSAVVNRNFDENVSEDHWLKQFEKNLQKSAVQPRTQESLFDQINSIMNRKSKHTSVEAAVEDMKERSGLTAYLKKSSERITDVIKTAQKSPEEYGFFDGKEDLENHGFGSDILSSLHSHKGGISHDHKSWAEYAKGYFDGSNMPEKHRATELNRLNTYFQKQNKTAADENDHFDKKIPIVIKKHPAIRKTFENCIRDSKGNLPIPAIIERVRSIHQGDVSDAKDWDEDKLIYLVSNLNLEAKKNNPSNFEDYSNLGGRDSNSNQDIDPSNNDAFFALNPAKI